MAKVPLISAMLLLATAGDLDLNEPVSKYANLAFVDPLVPVADVIEHRAGLTSPDLLTWRMLGPAERQRCLPEAPLNPGAGYSDLLANIVMAAVIESAASMTAEEFIRQCIVDPAGASGLVQYGADQPVVHPAVAGMPHSVVPLASERLADQISAVTPATGVFSCARGLLLVLDWLLFSGDGADRRLAAVTSRRAQALWDPVLRRPAAYPFGFMSDLELYGVTNQALGHTAAMAAWLALVEPEGGSVFVGYSNGIPLSEQDAWEARNTVLAALHTDRDRISSSTVSDTAPTAVGDELRQEPVERLRTYVGRPGVLPHGCSFSVEVQVDESAQRSVLLFEKGGLRAICHAVETTRCDLTLSGNQAVLSEWLADPNMRLGSLIQSGGIVPKGQLCYLSALEYWAATTV